MLDIATGGGHTALAFTGFTPTVVATDLTLPMLSAARKFIMNQGVAGVHFLAADAEALPFQDETFGVVTCRIAAHHFPELLVAIRQVARVLRRGGSFLVEDILGHDDPGERPRFSSKWNAAATRATSARSASSSGSLPPRAGLTVIDEAIMPKVRVWDEWTKRARMTARRRRRASTSSSVAAPARCREAYQFELDGDRVVSFADRMLLLRADKD